MSIERLQPYVDGRIFTGRQAKEIGLVDQLGTLNDAIKYAAKVAGIDEDSTLVYPEPEKVNFIEHYLQGMANRYLGINLTEKSVMGPQYFWDGY